MASQDLLGEAEILPQPIETSELRSAVFQWILAAISTNHECQVKAESLTAWSEIVPHVVLGGKAYYEDRQFRKLSYKEMVHTD